VLPAATEITGRDARFSSWKAIARYLGRSPRTVQRWQADYGLPVHRLGGDRGPIFAYAEELDGWLRKRGSRAALDEPALAHSVLEHAVLAQPVLAEMPAGARREVFDFYSAPGFRKGRSAELTTLAHGMWETLSSTDFGTMTRGFRDALDLDPGNGRAFAGLAFTLLAGGLLSNFNDPLCAASAEDALRRAVEIDPESPETRTARAWHRMAVLRDWKAARRGFQEALNRRPQHGPALVGEALLHIAEGSLAEASDLLLEASVNSPLSAPTLLLRSWHAYLAGNSAKALDLIAQARIVGHAGATLDALEALATLDRDDPEESLPRLEALAANARSHAPHALLMGVLGYAYAAAGQTREAQRILHDFLQLRARGRSDCSYPLALIFVGLTDRTNAVRWLRQSYADGALWSLGFQSDPMLATLRADPLYQTYLNNLNFPSPGNATSQLASAS
jgi:tetratricopeptide (TPR) repeat protein